MPNIKTKLPLEKRKKRCILKVPKKAQELPGNSGDSAQLPANHVFLTNSKNKYHEKVN